MQMQDSTHPTGVREVTKTTSRKALAAARQSKGEAAAALRLSGADWPQIAEALGYPTPRAALKAVERALAKRFEETDRTILRQQASRRLDRLLMSVWPKAIDPDNPEHLIASTKARELVADHRRLWGLDAPAEIIVSTPTSKEIDQWIAEAVAHNLPHVVEADVVDADYTEDDPLALEA